MGIDSSGSNEPVEGRFISVKQQNADQHPPEIHKQEAPVSCRNSAEKKADTYSTALAGTVVVAGAAVDARAGAGGSSAVATHFVV